MIGPDSENKRKEREKKGREMGKRKKEKHYRVMFTGKESFIRRKGV